MIEAFLKDKLLILCQFLVSKSHLKTKTNNELILIIVCVAKA